MTILERIAEQRRADVARLKAQGYQPPVPTPRADRERPSFRAALQQDGLAIIAEFKRRAPSAGELGAGKDPVEQARLYERGGAAAISVLTEPRFFSGSYDDLSAVAGAVDLPVLCKDFVVDAAQIAWATRAGAAAVLLIAALLDDGRLREFLDRAAHTGLDALVEVHRESELERALAAGAQIVGINNRDLRTFSVDLQKSRELVARLPEGVVSVAESGVHSASQVEELARAGFDAVLVGTSLMRSQEPDRQIRQWRDGSRAHAG